MNYRKIVLFSYVLVLVSSLLLFKNNNSQSLIVGLLLIFSLPFIEKYMSTKEVMLILYISAFFLTMKYTLVGDLLNGSDIYGEYVFAKIVYLSGKWDPRLSYDSYNYVVSDIFLLPILSKISGISVLVIIKIIPNIFASTLFPLLYYSILRIVKDRRIAFYSSYYFLIFPATYFVLPSVPRQEFSEFSFVLLIYIIIASTRGHFSKIVFLSSLLSFSMIVFHYGFSVVYIILGVFFVIVHRLISISLKSDDIKVRFRLRLLKYVLSVTMLLWIVWYVVIFKTYPGVSAIVILHKLMTMYSISSSGIAYVSKAGSINTIWRLMTISTLELYILIVVGLLVLCKYYVSIDKSIVGAYLSITLISLLFPILPLYSFGVLRSLHMVFFILAFSVGVSIATLNNKIQRFSILVLLILQITITASYLQLTPLITLGTSIDPSLNQDPLIDSWTTFDEYYGALFLKFHTSNARIFTDGPGRLPLHLALIFRGLNSRFEYNIYEYMSCNYMFFSKSAIEGNIIRVPKWTKGGLIWHSREFRTSPEFRYALTSGTIFYSSTGALIVFL